MVDDSEGGGRDYIISSIKIINLKKEWKELETDRPHF